MPLTFINSNNQGGFSLVNNTGGGQLSFNNSGSSVIPQPSVTPSVTVTPSISVTPSVTVTPTRTPSASLTPSISVTPSISITPSITPSISVTPSITPSSGGAVTFSQTFTGGQAPTTAIENAWTAFRAALTGTYTTMTLSSSLGTTFTVTDAKVQQIANALRTATTGTNVAVVIGSNTWSVIQGCVSGTADANSIYLTTGGSCACTGTYTIRPMIKNANWGGLAGGSCNQPTQTITITFS